MVNFATRFPNCEPHSHAFWILDFFLNLTLFVLRWFSLHYEILIMFLSHFPLILHQTQLGMPLFIAQLLITLVLIGTDFEIIWETFLRRKSLNSVLLLLLVDFVGGSRLDLLNFVRGSSLYLVYISIIVNIRSSLIHLHAFQLLYCYHSSEKSVHFFLQTQ